MKGFPNPASEPDITALDTLHYTGYTSKAAVFVQSLQIWITAMLLICIKGQASYLNIEPLKLDRKNTEVVQECLFKIKGGL